MIKVKPFFLRQRKRKQMHKLCYCVLVMLLNQRHYFYYIIHSDGVLTSDYRNIFVPIKWIRCDFLKNNNWIMVMVIELNFIHLICIPFESNIVTVKSMILMYLIDSNSDPRSDIYTKYPPCIINNYDKKIKIYDN